VIGERRLPSITTYPAHRQRVAHLIEQSGAGFGRGREAFPFRPGNDAAILVDLSASPQA